MKKSILVFAVAGLTMLSITSCKKEGPPKDAIKQTINVQMVANESYTFTLPKNKRDDVYEITSQALHSSNSELSVDANGNRIYSYTPVLNYSGTDRVVVSNDQERAEAEHHGGGHKGGGHGDCNGGEEDHYIVTINFTVNSNPTNKSK